MYAIIAVNSSSYHHNNYSNAVNLLVIYGNIF